MTTPFLLTAAGETRGKKKTILKDGTVSKLYGSHHYV